MVFDTSFMWVSIITYDNGTAKVPISAQIGVHVQVPTYEI